jgi:hypothetical protein
MPTTDPNPETPEGRAVLRAFFAKYPPQVGDYLRALDALDARDARIAALEALIHEDDPDSWPPKIVGSAAQAYVEGLKDRIAALEAVVVEAHDRATAIFDRGESEATTTDAYFLMDSCDKLLAPKASDD